jgi:hypothetical protein
MSKDLTTKQTQAVAAPTDLADWGTENKIGQDLLLAKILPMQPMSDLVTDSKAAIGEFRDSVSGAKLGSIAEPLEFIPFHVEKMWDVLVKNGDKFEWDHSMPLIEDAMNPAYNDNLPWADKNPDGVDIKRVRRMNFYVLLPSEIASGVAIPYILSFKSTSYKEGKKVLNQMYLRNRKAGLPPPAYSFLLAGTKEKNDQGMYIIPNVTLAKPSSKDQVQECLSWYKLVKAGSVKVDDSDLLKTENSVDLSDVQGTGAF